MGIKCLFETLLSALFDANSEVELLGLLLPHVAIQDKGVDSLEERRAFF